MRIFLIGFMGSGKSTLGKQLALNIHYPFIDLDLEIEHEQGKTIPEIFTCEGENKFREAELATLKNCIENHQDVVIATGGGTPCFFHNMDLMKESGLVVYLKLDIEKLQQRISGSHKIRPLVKQQNEEELKQWITKTLAQREVFYNRAHLIINSLNAHATTLLKYLSHFEQFNINGKSN